MAKLNEINVSVLNKAYPELTHRFMALLRLQYYRLRRSKVRPA